MSVRITFSARAQDILMLVAGEGLRVIFVSIAIGIGSAVTMGRLVASLLHRVSTRDPVVLGGAPRTRFERVSNGLNVPTQVGARLVRVGKVDGREHLSL